MILHEPCRKGKKFGGGGAHSKVISYASLTKIRGDVHANRQLGDLINLITLKKIREDTQTAR